MKQQISSTLKEIITLGCCKLNQSESLYCPIRVDSLDIKKHNADFATALQFKTSFVVTISVYEDQGPINKEFYNNMIILSFIYRPIQFRDICIFSILF